MIRDIRVQWMEGWANDPYFEVLVDRIPNLSEFLFRKPAPSLWYGECGIFVRFFSYSAPGDGYGGREFKVRTAEGEHILQGPWSSRAGSFNARGCGPCIEVSMTDDPNVWKRSYTFYHGALTVAAVQAALPLGVELRRQEKWNEPTWVPAKSIPMTLLQPQCHVCKTVHTITVPTTDYEKWRNGDLIQNCFSHLDPSTRELLISNTCGGCFDAMFRDD